jgi:N-acetylneuraminate synthase
MISDIVIAGRKIGRGHPVYIVAELSANHAHDLEQAAALVRAAHASGADAVKLQTYTPDTLTIDCDTAYFRIGKGTLWHGRNLYDLYKEAYTPWEWHPQLNELAQSLGLHLFSSVFDSTAVAFLERMGVPAYKISSFELVDLPLIKRAAATHKPLILSTGMGTLAEIAEAVSAAEDGGAAGVALLKCTSAYPATPDEMHLSTIPHLAETFAVPVGLSDHTLGFAVPVAAVALGACIVEKHLTLSRSIPGPDSAFSLEPEEFRAMAEAIRTVERARGRVHYGASDSEVPSRTLRRSLFVVQDTPAGAVLTDENVRSIRPGHGLPPKHYHDVLGRRLGKDVERGTPLSWDLLA